MATGRPYSCLLAGAAIGAGVVLAVAGLLLYHYAAGSYKHLYQEAVEYRGLLERYQAVLRELNQSGLLEGYRELARQLPRVRAALEDYRRVLGNASQAAATIEEFYNLTHSSWYNKTMKMLAGLAGNPILAVLLRSKLGLDTQAAGLLAALMAEAQEDTAKAAKIIEALQGLDRQAEKYLATLSRIVEELPPDRLERDLAQALGALQEADKALARLEENPPGKLEARGLAILAAGLALAGAGALLALRRCGP
ncbi:hypothetical protein CF15_07880 [Pyrodictium occultum]|uniref:Uncharacterized protein n=1 Tax=Pyrodictium occultum TaxID=2309 RepID=A0A0V8RS08_PYROC|nr:hypothetical protein [Pyrodictium occultum]KSW10698.1 hypothetical protein CF15_07880 [Pyrodictium occultum]